MSHNDLFGAGITAIVVIPSIAFAVVGSDWYQHRRALRQLRYEAERRAYRRALREAEREERG